MEAELDIHPPGQTPCDMGGKARWTGFTTAALICVTLLGFLFRYQVAANRPLHDDEIWSIMLSTGRGSVHLNMTSGEIRETLTQTTSLQDAPGWYHTPMAMRDATHPPGYFTLLGLWRSVMGASDLTARMFSVTCATGFLLVFFLTVHRLLGTEAAVWTTLTLAIAGPFVVLTSEARPYALELLAFSLACLGTVRLMGQPEETSQWKSMVSLAMLGGGTFLLAMSHYFAVGGMLGLMGTIALFLQGAVRRRAILTMVGVVLACGALWGHGFVEQYRAGRFSLSDVGTGFLRTERDSPVTPVIHALSSMSRLLVIDAQWPWLGGGILILGLSLATWLGRRSRNERMREAAGIFLVWIAGGVVVPLTLDLLRGSSHCEYDRYLVTAFPAIVALAACPVTAPARGTVAKAILRLLPGILLIAAAVSRIQGKEQGYGDYRNPVRFVMNNVTREDALIFAGPPDFPYLPRMQWLAFTHFAGEQGERNVPNVLALGPLPNDTLDRLKGRRCVIVAHPETPNVAALLPHHTLTASRRIDPLHAAWIAMPRNPAIPAGM